MKHHSAEYTVNTQEAEQFRAYFQDYMEFIPDFEGFLNKLAQPHKRGIRINTLKTEVQTCISRLRTAGAILTPCEASPHLYELENLQFPGNTIEYTLGYFHTQALSSALAVVELDPQPGEMVLDLCAAPGSKTSYMAQLMNNRGLVVANEKKWGRLSALVHTLNRLGVTNTVLTMYPGENLPRKCLFDKVMVDAPCSGEGRHRLHQRPPLAFSARVKKTLPPQQKRLLLAGFDLLKPGGVLLYSTCTYNPEENEAVTAHLLNNRPAVLLPVSQDLNLQPGVTRWRNSEYDPKLRHCRRVYPHFFDSLGFFMAKVAKPC